MKKAGVLPAFHFAPGIASPYAAYFSSAGFFAICMRIPSRLPDGFINIEH
jgi:hypothetical protein